MREEPTMLYDVLTKSDAVGQAEAIFVLAGRMERKEYGIELFRAGVAPLLVLSIGRFEVSKLRNMQLEGIPELITLRDATPASDRHFFMKFTASGVEVEKATLVTWNTYGEVLALRKLLCPMQARRVIVVSTDIHLRRVAHVVGKLFRNVRMEFCFCPVPPQRPGAACDPWPTPTTTA